MAQYVRTETETTPRVNNIHLHCAYNFLAIYDCIRGSSLLGVRLIKTQMLI